MVMKMDKEKLLDKYIRETFPLLTGVHPLTAEERKIVAESYGFQCYLVANAWRKMIDENKHCFPFNLLFKKEDEWHE